MVNWIEYLEINDKYAYNNKQKGVLNFIFLWLEINEYCNKKFENDISDREKMLKLQEENILKERYKNFKDNFLKEFTNLRRNGVLREFVVNMRKPNNQSSYKYFTSQKNDLCDFFGVIYQVRCNLFHGEKEPSAENVELVLWAYDCLNKLFKGIIQG